MNTAHAGGHASAELEPLEADGCDRGIGGFPCAVGLPQPYPVDELIKKSFQDVTHPDDLAAEVAQVELMHQGKIDSYGVDKRYLRKDGAIVWGRKTVGSVAQERRVDRLF